MEVFPVGTVNVTIPKYVIYITIDPFSNTLQSHLAWQFVTPPTC